MVTATSDPRTRVLAKLGALGDIEKLPKAEWEAFLDELPLDEFAAFLQWYQENKEADARAPYA
jgi:hypothetical protein